MKYVIDDYGEDKPLVRSLMLSRAEVSKLVARLTLSSRGAELQNPELCECSIEASDGSVFVFSVDRSGE